ncbi:MAG: hypothetical protein ACK5PB_10340 [Pirellula sp.]
MKRSHDAKCRIDRRLRIGIFAFLPCSTGTLCQHQMTQSFFGLSQVRAVTGSAAVPNSSIEEA